MNEIRYCFVCGTQVAAAGRIGRRRHLDKAARTWGFELPPRPDSHYPDEEEHMAFQHRFKRTESIHIDGRPIDTKRWVGIGADNFGEIWERTTSEKGRRVGYGFGDVTDDHWSNHIDNLMKAPYPA